MTPKNNNETIIHNHNLQATIYQMNYPRCIFLKTLYYRLCRVTGWHDETISLYRIPKKYSIHSDHFLERCGITLHKPYEYSAAEKYRIGRLYLMIAEKTALLMDRMEAVDVRILGKKPYKQYDNIDVLLECDWQFIYEMLRSGDLSSLSYIHYYLKRAGWLQSIPVSFAVLYALLKSPQSESSEARSYYHFFDTMLTIAITNNPTDITDPVFRGIRLGRPREISQAWFPIHFRYACAVDLLKRNHYSAPLWESLGYLKIIADAYKNNPHLPFPVLPPHITIEKNRYQYNNIDPSFIAVYYKELFTYVSAVFINDDLITLLITLLEQVTDDAFINKAIPQIITLLAHQARDTVYSFSESLWPLLHQNTFQHHIHDLWMLITDVNVIQRQNTVSDIFLYYAVVTGDYDNALYIAQRRTSEQFEFSLYETIYTLCREFDWTIILDTLIAAGVKEIIALTICTKSLETIDDINTLFSTLTLPHCVQGEYILRYVSAHLANQGKNDLAGYFVYEMISFLEKNSVPFDITNLFNDSNPRVPVCVYSVISKYLLDCDVCAENSDQVLAFLDYTAQDNPDYYDTYFPLLIDVRPWNSYKDLDFFAHLFKLAVYGNHYTQIALLREQFIALSKDILQMIPESDLLSLAHIMHDLKETKIVAALLTVLPDNTISYIHSWLIDNPAYLSQSSYEYMCTDFFLSLTTSRWSLYYLFSDYIDTFRKLLLAKGWSYVIELTTRKKLLFYPDAYDFYYLHNQSMEIVTILCALNSFDNAVEVMLQTIVPLHMRQVYERWEKIKTSLIHTFASGNIQQTHRLLRTLNNPIKKNTILKWCCDYFNAMHDYTSLLFCLRYACAGLSDKDIILYATSASDARKDEHVLALSEFITDTVEREGFQHTLLFNTETAHPNTTKDLIAEERYLDALASASHYERSDIFIALVKNGHVDYVYDHLQQHEKDHSLLREIIRHFIHENNYDVAQRFLSLYVACKSTQYTYNPDSDEEKADMELSMVLRRNNTQEVCLIVKRMIRSNSISAALAALEFYAWKKDAIGVHMIVNIFKQAPRNFILNYIEYIIRPLYLNNYTREALPFCRQFWHYFWGITDEALFLKELENAFAILPAFNFKSNFRKIVSKFEDWGLEFLLSESSYEAHLFSYNNIIKYISTLNEYPRFQRAYLYTLLSKKSCYPWFQGMDVFKYFSKLSEKWYDVLLGFSIPNVKNKSEMKEYLHKFNKLKIPATVKKFWKARVLYWHGN